VEKAYLKDTLLNGRGGITVSNVTASYGKTPALVSVSAVVEGGSIYALLGPSGCGKTTLLSCILARKKVDSGTILVDNSPAFDRTCSVGYMPQDICLYQEFTIRETFQYFGSLHSMARKEVKHRQEELLDMLDLPEKKRQVRNMSGGQRRRLSLSVALLHQPKILILDEPTVGVDPIVRSRIWNHLSLLGRSGVTTVITTHYVEEARQADTVGIMREGKIMVEEEPDGLMIRFGVETLEKAFLKLCTEGEFNMPTESKDTSCMKESTMKVSGTNSSAKSLFPSLPSLSNIRAMTLKNWLTTKRNLWMLYFIFLAPAILCTLDCLAVGQRPSMIPVSVINQESSCDMFDPGQCQPDRLGCHFIQTLNTMQEVRIVSNNTRHLARITIPENLSISYLKRVLPSDLFYKFTWVFSVDGAEAVGKYEKISVSIDMSNPVWSGFLKETIITSLDKFQRDISSLCGESYGVNLDFSLLDPLTPTLSVTDYREYITCAAVMLPVYFLAVARTATAFIAERSQGLLERSLVAGVLPLEILLSFIASQLITVFIQVLIVIITVFYGFGLPCRGNIVYYVILVMLQGILYCFIHINNS